jgi:lysyl-tRNA synthetase class 2
MPGDYLADWRPAASRQAIEGRAALLAAIREYFSKRGVLEVETPILSQAGNTDTNIMALQTSDPHPGYLRTSPEYPMKRLLAAGFTDIYELGKVFRAGEQGAWHNPEFTLLEWYRAGWSYLELAQEVIDLVKHCLGTRSKNLTIEHTSYHDLFLQTTGLDPWLAEEDDWASLAAERGIQAGSLDVQQWQDLILTHVIQPAMASDVVTVVYDYPASQAALARIRPGAKAVAERFEVYLGRVELANGYQELGDAAEQIARFENDNRLRSLRGDGALPIDFHLVEALRQGLPECSGVALGVDRLLMRVLDLERIDSVLTFPLERA